MSPDQNLGPRKTTNPEQQKKHMFFFLGCDIPNITLWLNTSPLKKDQKLPSKAGFICSYLRPTPYLEKVLLIVGDDEQISRNAGVSQNYMRAKKCGDVSSLQIVTIDSRALEFREMQSFDSYETTISHSQPPHFFVGFRRVRLALFKPFPKP